MNNIIDILNQPNFSKTDLITLLSAQGEDRTKIFEKAAEIKKKIVGNKVYFRGLIEFNNICIKDCYYCGIRRENKNVVRYSIPEEDILEAVKFAHKSRYGSVVLQGGEQTSISFTKQIATLLKKMKEATNNEIGITISLGEQSEDTYNEWFESGAHRYLLRIETSNRELYKKIHPDNDLHNFEKRLNTLQLLRETGFQVGTGVMIGLPFQTMEHLADDLLFYRDINIDMVGMGPYIEHSETPLYQYKDTLLPLKERFDLSLKMVAILRILMPSINIAAATALQAIDPIGREKAIKVGANIIMPNITPTANRKNYQLYENKPCIDEGADDCTSCISARITIAGDEIGYGEWGDSKHFISRKMIV